VIIDSFIPPSSWAYSPPTPTYTSSPTLGGDLLDDAGWNWPVGEDYRMKDGRELAISLKTSDAQLRIDVVAAYTTQLAACGIRLIGLNLPIEYFFGQSAFGPTVLPRRDFSIAEFGWITGVDEISYYGLYGCEAIPSPSAGYQELHGLQS
jgi:ABC-type transport system substrate-binding protein